MDAYYSDDDGNTEALLFDIPSSSAAIGLCSFGIGDLGYIGASSEFPYAAKLWETDGTSLTVVSLPTLTGSVISGVGGGYVGGVLRVVCWTNDGELLFRDPVSGDWALSANQPDGVPYAVTCNSAMLIMSVNKSTPPNNEGIEQTSVDGDNWTERLRTTIGGTESFVGLAALMEPQS